MSKHPRNLAVADRLGQAGAAGVFRGLAQMKAFNAYVAAGAEISVERNGNRIKIHWLVAATDPTYAVNNAQIDRQVARSFVYGLSALFYQECTVKNGAIGQTNFDTYGSVRIADMTKVESIIMPSGGGEALASPASAWPRLRRSTPISRRRAGASARSCKRTTR